MQDSIETFPIVLQLENTQMNCINNVNLVSVQKLMVMSILSFRAQVENKVKKGNQGHKKKCKK